MYKFFLKTCLIGLFLSACTVALLSLSTNEKAEPYITTITGSTEYGKGYNMGPSEIIPYIDKVSVKDNTTSLILGDSVCFRMFSELQDYNPNFCIAGSNRAITLSGQYILLNLYLEAHPDATDVYLILLEDSLITTYETGYGYQYAVMPFLMTDTLDLLDKETITQLKRTYGHFMISQDSAQFINDSPFGKKLYLNLINKIAPVSSEYEIPDVVERYLVKMVTLCEENDVSLHLLASPLADTPERREIEPLMTSLYEDSVLYSYFPDYFNQLEYYPSEYFSDGVHPDVDRALLNEMIEQMEQNADCMYDLVLDPNSYKDQVPK